MIQDAEVVTGAFPVRTQSRLAGIAKGAMSFARAKPLGAISAFAILSLVVIAIFGPFFQPYDPDDLFVGKINQAPSGEFWFGTDNLGRDVLSRAIAGTRISLYVGVVAVLVATSIGAAIGLISGYYAGTFDILVQRVIDALQAFPALILALGIIAVRGPSTNNALLVISVVLIPGGARIVRGAVLSAKENIYVDASRALGATNMRIMFRHILPNVTAPIIVNASILLGAAILFEASLSFLGAGGKPTDPSWGAMISGRAGSGVNTILDYQQWPWLAAVPAAMICAAVFSFNLLGDAIRDVMDPRLRGTGGRLG